MNCCDYDCTQGRDCPARATCETPTLTAAEVEARELAETMAHERLWMAWLLAGAGVVVVASFSLGYLTAALGMG